MESSKSHPRIGRRRFVRNIANSSLGAFASIVAIRSAFATALQEMGPPSDAWHFDDAYWSDVRDHFMLEEDFAYMNNGTLGPTPTPVFDAMSEYWRLMAINPNENSAILQREVETIRRKAASFVGASPDEIAIMRNTTEGLNTIIKGFDWNEGDEILISYHEHASHLRPWQLHAERHGIKVIEVPIGIPPESPEAIVEEFQKRITPRTRAISIAFVTTITGCILPVKQLADLAHSHDLLCFADGAQATGMFQYNLTDLGVDAFATSSHKWLCGPAGTGLLFVRKDIQDTLWPNVVTQNFQVEEGARKYDRLSRRPWPVVAALEDTLEFQLSVGKHRVENRVRALAGYLRNEASKIEGVTLYTSQDTRLAGGITTLSVKGIHFRDLQDFLREKYNTYVSTQQKGELYPANVHGVDGIRISTHFYNTFEQVDGVLEGLRIAAKKGI